MAVAPIVSSYNDKIRPLLDAVDKLRYLKVMEEGIQLPTIVVVGDQSSGKSSVLESLAGISLPRGQGICTRVPLIMRLQNHSVSETELSLEFNGKTLKSDESRIAEDVVAATDEIAGDGKGISHNPLTLLVKKQGVPDLTMVDLPGITRVPVKGQPEDIYEQISNIIFQYIQPKESIILNVLSATVDFSTCESIRMSQRVDRTGERTLAVVTKADKAPEGLLEKVTADDVNIGLGYVCVRNRVGDETYEEARVEEVKLFESHPLLSKIDKSIVGIPVLAKKLVQIQAMSISRSLPDIVKLINAKLSNNVSELNKMPQNLSSIAEAMTAFMRIIGLVKESLRKVLIRGEYDEYPDEENMHCAARLAEMLNQYHDDLQSSQNELHHAGDFLMEEIRILEETKSIELPNFLPRTAFLAILQRQVNTISGAPISFVRKVWTYVGEVVISVLMFHSDNYPQLQSSMRRAANGLISKVMENSVGQVIEMVEMEKMIDYTCNPNYMSCWNKLMCQIDMFMEVVGDDCKGNKVKLKAFGEVEIGHLRKHGSVVREAFDLKMRMTAYWRFVLMRLVDGLALHLLFSLNKLVNKDMETEIVSEMMAPTGGGIEQMLEESPSVAEKRKRLNKSIKLLKESELVVTKIMDRIHLLDV
ncbi:Dynamin stalk domain [Dillenia turbinata]|uniref:Dynamin stalk domain n=1 Tax=Dillenia turbinata TaxID=194707 RepID=A0AAN8WGR5_9MAGN